METGLIVYKTSHPRKSSLFQGDKPGSGMDDRPGAISNRTGDLRAGDHDSIHDYAGIAIHID